MRARRPRLTVNGLVSIMALAALTGLTPPAFARRGPGTSELRCSMSGGFGLLVTGNRKLTCVYYRPDGAVEFYVGSTNSLGFDLGPSTAARVAYRVVGAPPTTPGALQGDFGGVGAGISLGQGLGASALVGGSGAALVPIDNVYSTGLNGNIGLGLLHLDYAGMEPTR